MRFGIMEMQMSFLAPAGLSPQQILQYVGAFDHRSHVARLAETGFDPIELNSDLALFFPQSFTSISMENLLSYKQEHGLTYTVHLPLWSIEPSTPQAAVRQGSLRVLIDTVKATLPLDPEVFVLHATGALAAEFYHMKMPELARPLVLAQFQNNAQATIESLLMETGLDSRRLAIETIEFPFDLTLELAERLDLSICLDTGHILVGFSGPIGLFEALERCLTRLAEVHLHDGAWQGPEHLIGYGKDHKPLGTGDLDVGLFLDRLDKAGFKGPLVLELNPAEALASIEFIRKVRPQYLPPSFQA